MKHSTDRILTTHVGSLPRSKAVTDVVFGRERGDAIDAADFESVISHAVVEVVLRQRESQVDVVSDGEMSKISYATYIKDRLTGFDGDSSPRAAVRRPTAGRVASARSHPKTRAPCKTICAGSMARCRRRSIAAMHRPRPS